MFDIAKLAASETAAIHLKDAKGAYLYDDKQQPLRITVYGPGSKSFTAIEERQSARALKRMQDNDNKVSLAPAEQRRQEEAEDLAAITVAFENFTYEPAGKTAGRELFEAFYADPKMGFITKQVGKFASDWGNFTAAS